MTRNQITRALFADVRKKAKARRWGKARIERAMNGARSDVEWVLGMQRQIKARRRARRN